MSVLVFASYQRPRQRLRGVLNCGAMKTLIGHCFRAGCAVASSRPIKWLQSPKANPLETVVRLLERLLGICQGFELLLQGLQSGLQFCCALAIFGDDGLWSLGNKGFVAQLLVDFL